MMNEHLLTELFIYKINNLFVYLRSCWQLKTDEWWGNKWAIERSGHQLIWDTLMITLSETTTTLSLYWPSPGWELNQDLRNMKQECHAFNREVW